MPYDIVSEILSLISSYAVGLAKPNEQRVYEVLGSGVLVSIEGRRGILTCGHVAEAYRNLPEVGLIRVVAGKWQRSKLDLSETNTIIVESRAVREMEDLDLAFTFLPPDTASSIGARSSFLNVETNRAKAEDGAPAEGVPVDVMLGLVAEFSGTPFTWGHETVSPMRAVLHTGHIQAYENALATFVPMDYNLQELPTSFGGMSGAGMWRIYFVEDGGRSKIIKWTLLGVAAWQIEGTTKIACQSWERIDQALIPEVRKNQQF